MVGSGDPAHHAAAARVVLAGDAVGLRTGGATGKLPVLGAAWYKNPEPTFSDSLAAVRRLLWAEEAVRPILWRDDCPTWRSRPRTAEKPRPINKRLAELMSYAA